MRTLTRRLLVLSVSLLLAACAAQPPARLPPLATPALPAPASGLGAVAPRLDTLAATLWMRTAAEYQAGALQAYAAARIALDQALADPAWTAAAEQREGYGALPTAIILDVDETVLDNSPYQVRLLLAGRRYDLDGWHAWCEERRAEAIPGAVAFTRYAAERGVIVFYLTNRRAVVTEATRDNLLRQGFPLAAGREVVMTRGLKPQWDSSDKGPRRAAVAQEFRVLLLIGDDLGDFLSGIRVSPHERAALAAKHAGWWGSRWIVLPNPIYGSWWDALTGFDAELSEEEALEARREALRR
jgi:acid phosphatase